MSNRAEIFLLLACLVFCSRQAVAEELTVPSVGGDIAIGNFEMVDGARLRLDLFPREGHGFCRKKVLLFDVAGSRAIPQDQSRWLFVRSDRRCESVAADSYIEFEELEAWDIRSIDRFVEGAVRISRGEQVLGRDIKVEDPQNLARCLAGADWKMEQLYQNPIAPDEVPEVVMKVHIARNQKGCIANTLYLRGRFQRDDDGIVISILSAAAIAR